MIGRQYGHGHPTIRFPIGWVWGIEMTAQEAMLEGAHGSADSSEVSPPKSTLRPTMCRVAGA